MRTFQVVLVAEERDRRINQVQELEATIVELNNSTCMTFNPPTTFGSQQCVVFNILFFGHF